jgi:hypothetical protein
MIAFVLNLPYTLVALVMVLLLGPKQFSWNERRCALVFRVRRDSLPPFLPKGWRGFALGHIVALNPKEEPNDLEHELIHVDQHRKYPLIQPGMYLFENLTKGYRNNRFEIEAYGKSGSIYRAGKPKD